MKTTIACLLLLVAGGSGARAAIFFLGRYNGTVIFDRWDGCHLLSGVYDMEVSEKVKELLRPYTGRAVQVDVKQAWRPISPGDVLITKLEVLGPAVEPASVTGGNAPPLLDGLVLTAAPSFAENRPDEFVITLHNAGSAPREIGMSALAPTLFAKKTSDGCLFSISASDGPSYAAVTRSSIPSLYSGGSGTCTSGDNEMRVRLFLEAGLVFPEHRSLASGESVEVPIRFDLSPGEYEFVAGYGGGAHQARSLGSGRFGFDVDASGQAHLVGGAIAANLNRGPRSLGTICGKALLSTAEPASGAHVYLWPYPLEKYMPRAVAAGPVDADGSFHFTGVHAGKYVLTATLERPSAFLAATLGSHATDDPALTIPAPEGCTLQLILAPTTVYSVIGQTEPNPANTPVRKIQLRTTSGDAYPFATFTIVQPDGRYEFHNLPAGGYAFSAGHTGRGFDLEANIDNLNVNIDWSLLDGSFSGGPPMSPEFNETMVYLALTQHRQAEAIYAKTYGKGFAANLSQLAQPPSWASSGAEYAGLFDPPDLAALDAGAMSFSTEAYRYTYVPTEADGNGKISSYQFCARPLAYGTTGGRSFWIDQEGVVRGTDADRAATKDDPKADIH